MRGFKDSTRNITASVGGKPKSINLIKNLSERADRNPDAPLGGSHDRRVEIFPSVDIRRSYDARNFASKARMDPSEYIVHRNEGGHTYNEVLQEYTPEQRISLKNKWKQYKEMQANGQTHDEIHAIIRDSDPEGYPSFSSFLNEIKRRLREFKDELLEQKPEERASSSSMNRRGH